jgi:hypothetical protein
MSLNSKKTARKTALRLVHTLSLLLAFGLTAAALSMNCGKQAEQSSGKAKTTRDTVLAAETPDSVTINLTGEDSVSVFALLRRDHKVDYKSTAMGVFVTGIDSLKTGSGYFWVYTVNDTTPPVACNRVLTRNGDSVQWHYRK